MEKNTFTEATESYFNNLNSAGKWMSQISSAFIDNYGKQILSATDWYSKLINETSKDGNFNASDVFIKSMEQFSNSTKIMISSVVDIFNQHLSSVLPQKEMAEAIIKAYDVQAKLFMEMNKKFFDVLKKQADFHTGNTNKDFEDFTRNIASQFESSRESIKVIMDYYSKMTNNISDTNSELLKKINAQIDELTKSNLRIWSDLMNSSFTVFNSNANNFYESKFSKKTQQDNNSGDSSNEPVEQ